MSAVPPSYPGFLEISRNFAPGWFAAVMGSGVLALSTYLLAGQWTFLMPLAWVLHYFNLYLFAVLSVPWITRWIVHHEAALATFRHPVQASFYPTFSIAMLVIASQYLVFGEQIELALRFWWAGAVLALVFSFAVLYSMFSGEHVALEHVTPAKFIPAVGLVVIPIAGGPLLAHLSGIAHDLALVLNIVGLGAGMLMYVGLLSLTLQRKYLAKPAFGILTPTVWIHLAPLGVIPLSLFNLREQLPFAVPVEGFIVFGLLLWGFGVWWLVMASILTLAARRRGLLPFALTWWGFTFPLGSFALSSFRLAKLSGIESLEVMGVVVWGLLLVLWLLTLVKTVQGVVSGAVFKPLP